MNGILTKIKQQSENEIKISLQISKLLNGEDAISFWIWLNNKTAHGKCDHNTGNVLNLNLSDFSFTYLLGFFLTDVLLLYFAFNQC